MLHDPEIILLDEASSNLDASTRDYIFNTLVELMRNKTVILITHDKEMLKYFQRVIYLQDGKIIHDSEHQ
jgi:ABC-type bacteriocin/lantibiotic exporter with double-glycine peptidase domain